RESVPCQRSPSAARGPCHRNSRLLPDAGWPSGRPGGLRLHHEDSGTLAQGLTYAGRLDVPLSVRWGSPGSGPPPPLFPPPRPSTPGSLADQVPPTLACFRARSVPPCYPFEIAPEARVPDLPLRRRPRPG